jgi:hypothetical protein
MLGERNTLQRFTIRAEEEEDRWGPGGINTPKSRTITVIFQSSEPLRKISELSTSEISAGCSPCGRNLRENTRNLRTRKEQGQKQQQISSLWVWVRV